MTSRPDPRAAIRRLNITGFVVLVVVLGGAGAWATTTQLSGAVIAPGTVVVESNVKKVQHATGGIVGELYVRNGVKVEQGQILLRLDETVARATLGIVSSQIDELSAREARLDAERNDRDALAFPDTLTKRRSEPTVAIALSDEEKLFQSRRAARTGQRAQLKEQIAQIEDEIRGLGAQREATEKEIKFIEEELKGVADLYKNKLVTIDRFMKLQRAQVNLYGSRGRFIADVARARGKISEIENQVLQIDRDFRTEVLKELREVQGKIAELHERETAAKDQLRRLEIRAPQAGFVHQLVAHTVGGVVTAGETIMLIVPRSDKLVVEAHVAPHDIDQVNATAKVVARVMAGNQRTSPDIQGTITRVSADLTQDSPTSAPYYLVRASLAEEGVARLHGMKLVPGMPVTLFVQTQDRTPLEFLIKPLKEQIAHAFRER
jgi:HlyD family secretion protein